MKDLRVNTGRNPSKFEEVRLGYSRETSLNANARVFKPNKEIIETLRHQLSPEDNYNLGDQLYDRKLSHIPLHRVRGSAHEDRGLSSQMARSRRARINSVDNKLDSRALQGRKSDDMLNNSLFVNRIRPSQVNEKTNSQISSKICNNKLNNTDLSLEEIESRQRFN
jgi:hypothetical protein